MKCIDDYIAFIHESWKTFFYQKNAIENNGETLCVVAEPGLYGHLYGYLSVVRIDVLLAKSQIFPRQT